MNKENEENEFFWAYCVEREGNKSSIYQELKETKREIAKERIRAEFEGNG